VSSLDHLIINTIRRLTPIELSALLNVVGPPTQVKQAVHRLIAAGLVELGADRRLRVKRNHPEIPESSGGEK
jgi:hypothetical protein